MTDCIKRLNEYREKRTKLDEDYYDTRNEAFTEIMKCVDLLNANPNVGDGYKMLAISTRDCVGKGLVEGYISLSSVVRDLCFVENLCRMYGIGLPIK